jgi:hypothetical protein
MRSSMRPDRIPEIVTQHGQGPLLWSFLTCSTKDIGRVGHLGESVRPQMTFLVRHDEVSEAPE